MSEQEKLDGIDRTKLSPEGIRQVNRIYGDPEVIAAMAEDLKIKTAEYTKQIVNVFDRYLGNARILYPDKDLEAGYDGDQTLQFCAVEIRKPCQGHWLRMPGTTPKRTEILVLPLVVDSSDKSKLYAVNPEGHLFYYNPTHSVKVGPHSTQTWTTPRLSVISEPIGTEKFQLVPGYNDNFAGKPSWVPNVLGVKTLSKHGKIENLPLPGIEIELIPSGQIKEPGEIRALTVARSQGFFSNSRYFLEVLAENLQNPLPPIE